MTIAMSESDQSLKIETDDVAVTIKTGAYKVGVPVELFIRNGEKVELLVE